MVWCHNSGRDGYFLRREITNGVQHPLRDQVLLEARGDVGWLGALSPGWSGLKNEWARRKGSREINSSKFTVEGQWKRAGVGGRCGVEG